MPKILSLEKGQTTEFNLSSLAFWRLGMGVTGYRGTPCLGLMLRYPPGSPENQVCLAKVKCTIAESAEEVQRVAAVALDGGTLDLDQDRAKEAFNLFKNNPKIKGDVLERTIEEAYELIKAYWIIRLWAQEGYRQDKKLTVDQDTTLFLRSDSGVSRGTVDGDT